MEPLYDMTNSEKFITTECVRAHNVKDIHREKHPADEVDLEILMKHLWCFDTTPMVPRERIQLALMTMIHCYSAGRPGAFSATKFVRHALDYSVRSFSSYSKRWIASDHGIGLWVEGRPCRKAQPTDPDVDIGYDLKPEEK